MWKTLVKCVVSGAVLAGLFMITDTSAIAQRLGEADVFWLGVTLICLTILTLLMAKRWQMAAHALDLDLGYGRAVREYYLAQLINMVLPGGVAGDAARAVRLRNEGDLIRAAQSVVLERLIGQFAMFSLLFGGFVMVLLVPGGVAWPVHSWAILAITVVVAGAGFFAARRNTTVAKFTTLAAQLIRQPLQIALSVIIALLTSAGFYASAKATGTTLPLSTLFTLIPLVLTAMLIPLSIGGWGWREGAAAALFPFAGASASAGIATGIAYGAMLLIAALPALILMVIPTSK